jgi:predicted nucleotidyltransferase
MIIPNMGTLSGRSHGLADVLFSPVQQRLLGLLYGQPQRRFQSAELIRLAGSGTGAAHRLLTRLADAGIVSVTHSGNQKHYQANRESPIFTDLHKLVVKTVGDEGALAGQRARIAKLCQRYHVRRLDLFGSAARTDFDAARSDLDFLVEFDEAHLTLGLDTYLGLKADLEKVLGRPVDLLIPETITNPYVKADIARDRLTVYAA